MPESTEICKDFIDALVEIDGNSAKVERVLVMEKGWPEVANHKAINGLLGQLSTSEKETPLALLQYARQFGMGAAIEQVGNRVRRGEWTITSADDNTKVAAKCQARIDEILADHWKDEEYKLGAYVGYWGHSTKGQAGAERRTYNVPVSCDLWDAEEIAEAVREIEGRTTWWSLK